MRLGLVQTLGLLSALIHSLHTCMLPECVNSDPQQSLCQKKIPESTATDLHPANPSSQVKKVGTLWVKEHRVHLRNSQNLGDGWQFKKTLKELFCFLCSSLTWCSVLRVDSIIVHFATCCCVNICFFLLLLVIMTSQSIFVELTQPVSVCACLCANRACIL